MALSEVEIMVAELEVRIERLRALYDQYFTGIEKLEPSVARKDVERRLEVLRRMQIRNTGLRFRFQVIVQRYNTYQTYWLRVCRQIENGTFKRHVLRAKARFGSDRPGAAPVRAAAPGSDDVSEDVPLDELMDATAEAPRAARAARAVAELEAGLLGSGGDGLDLELDDAFNRMNAPSTAVASPLGRAVATPEPLPRRSSPDADDFGRIDEPGWDAEAPRPAAPRAAPAAAPGTKRVVIAKRAAAPSAPDFSHQAAAGPAVRSPAASSPDLPPASSPRGAAPMRRPVPTDAEIAAAARGPSHGAPDGAPVTPVRPAAARPAPLPAGGGPAEDRVRQIYARYVDAKRANGESTAAVTYEALAQSLKDSSEKLRARVGANRNIDFEVATKDGKTVLKPVVK